MPAQRSRLAPAPAVKAPAAGKSEAEKQTQKRADDRRRALANVDADGVESEGCSGEELADLLADVKSKAAEIKALEAKLTALNKDDTVKLKSMLKAEECELNGFDGCSAWRVTPRPSFDRARAARRHAHRRPEYAAGTTTTKRALGARGPGGGSRRRRAAPR